MLCRIPGVGVAEGCARSAPAQALRKKLLPARQELPIWICRDRLVEEIKAHPVLIVVGETGSGAHALPPSSP